jgi:RNA polymerase sigma-70 factor (ECF subfamily)
MDQQNLLTEQFEANRPRMRAVAYRMLGSLGDAEDAVQEAWLRLGRTDMGGVENLAAWLTTVVARVCLDMLRSRKSRREESLGAQTPEGAANRAVIDPEEEAELADSVGLAMMVVLATLPPPERLAFVLHDMFDLSLDEIAPIVDRTPTAARQLASRARRRVRAPAEVSKVDLARQREAVEAYLAASRGGDFDGLLAVLDPDVVLRADARAVAAGASPDLRGAHAVAQHAVARRATFARAALVNGAIGIVVAPRGRLLLVLAVTLKNGKIAELEAIADPHRLGELDLAVLSD